MEPESGLKEEKGLTTNEALEKLHNDIAKAIAQFKILQKNRKGRSWLRDTLHHSSQHTTINWISSSFLVWAVISLFIVGGALKIIYALIILLLLAASLGLQAYDNQLRHAELTNRVQAVLRRIEQEKSQIAWGPEHYPDLYSPISPCITLQWTYRDNRLVNLPWALLVENDVVLLRPGQSSPGFCEALDKNAEFPLLHAKEVYSPCLQNANEIFSAPKLRINAESKKYKLLETPYLANLRIYLEQALDRPVTQLNQQRHLVMVRIIERILLPFVFFAILCVNLGRFWLEVGRNETVAMFFLVPTNAVLPLLPLVFPIVWNLVNYLGLARFKTVFDLAKSKIEQFEENLDTDDAKREEEAIKCDPWIIYRNFLRIWRGEADILAHSANILHVLGSVTALGCVDKKGVLSWPNPAAEKVFFLRNNDNNDDEMSPASSLGNVGDLTQDGESIGGGHLVANFINDSPDAAHVEVLDLTHNHNDPFKLNFDDQDWGRFLTSLKPLGLAILLNTCNLGTQEKYTSFCSHITCEAIYNENLVPVTNRRCLCELAKEIGFSDKAQKIFALEHQLSAFRHLQPEMVRRDNKYARSLHLSTKLKCPFPQMFAVIVKELSSGGYQLLSEGTADIVLDSCVDYWNGSDLCPLGHSDRKRIQDFYQRSSLTAYCTAFAYRPLNKSVNNVLENVYLELPSDSRSLYTSYRSPTPVHWDCRTVLEPKMIKSSVGQFYSTDSLLYNDCPSMDITDAESYFHLQCNQVFIGMVTMQYQAITDMVQLIEQLERSCIRFVHFSKENELRSRVFSEKMGLESGWNCHISLLSERNSNLESLKAMSFSAPSAINMEHSVVKFDTIEMENIDENGGYGDDEEDDIEMNKSDQNGVYKKLSTNETENALQQNNEINTSHDWQSLSCLTDSTEQSAPINFDMSNRAKLPRGIDKIRPHIELIDNVPLLVSLFTDCTPSATREMLHIMQDYNEIVCILGSVANCDNSGIFMQADASIAVEPLHPQICQNLAPFCTPTTCYSPIDLARDLSGVACSLCVKREDPISFYHLIMESRHFVTTLWSCIQFWLCCCVTLSLMQFICVIAMLPDLFSTGQVLYLVCFVVPILSVSLLGLPIDGDVMKKPQAKNHIAMNWNLAVFMLWCYGCKFLASIVVVMVCLVGILGEHCYQVCETNANCTCDWYFLASVDGEWGENGWSLGVARILVDFVVLVHFVVISVGFVYRDHLIYKRLPFRNIFWLTTSILLIVIQGFYTIIALMNLNSSFNEKGRLPVPKWVIIFAAVSPIFVLLANELIKQQEIKVNKRFRKRARLDFGTKLGMNSPF